MIVFYLKNYLNSKILNFFVTSYKLSLEFGNEEYFTGVYYLYFDALFCFVFFGVGFSVVWCWCLWCWVLLSDGCLLGVVVGLGFRCFLVWFFCFCEMDVVFCCGFVWFVLFFCVVWCVGLVLVVFVSLRRNYELLRGWREKKRGVL